MSARIEAYAVIGDGGSAALVSRGGSIDWLCWPRFDSSAGFAALLGGPEHGRWLIAATREPSRITRRSRHHPLSLQTTMETAEGAVAVVDVMPARGKDSDVVRLVRGDRGRVQMHTELVLLF